MPTENTYTPERFKAVKAQLRQKGHLSIQLVSGSMSPLMKTGTKAVIESCSFDELRPLDIIVFFNGEILICHTIWDFGRLPAPNGDRTVVTRGLANPFADDPVRESFILGRVISHRITKMGFIMSAVRASIANKLGFGSARKKGDSYNLK